MYNNSSSFTNLRETEREKSNNYLGLSNIVVTKSNYEYLSKQKICFKCSLSFEAFIESLIPIK